MKSILTANIVILSLAAFVFSSCGDDDAPPIENMEEEITRITAVFTNRDDASDVITAIWFDEDGEGTIDPVVDDVVLSTNTEYHLELFLENTLADPVEDITNEVKEEASEHMFFFGFTDGMFADPAGNGNIDGRNDPLNYLDADDNTLPLGLETVWTTGDATTGDLQIILKHQPDIKSETSTSADGETDVDISFDVTIE